MSKTSLNSDLRNIRIDEGLSSIVERFFPFSKEGEHDEDDYDPDQDLRDRENHRRGFELAKSIIERHKTLAVESNDHHIADLIEKRLLEDYNSREDAAQFSDLYDQLCERPVLSQKWGILYLLHLLSAPDSDDDDDEEAYSSNPPASSSIDGDDHTEQTTIRLPPDTANPPDPVHPVRPIPDNSRESFPTAELLPPLPSSAQRDRSIESARTKFPAEKADGDKVEEAQDSDKKDVLSQEQVPPEETKNDKPKPIPIETALLRDLPFTLQGLSTTHLEFTSSNDLAIRTKLPRPLIGLLHALAEPSLLYRQLSISVQTPVEGVIAQSLMSAIGTELRSYLALVSTLEAEIRRSVKDPSDGGGRRGAVGRVGVTLRRCIVWTREATMGLRFMNTMAQRVKSGEGGRLISMVHEFSAVHGDPFIAAFAERILVHVTKPFYDMLRQWIYDGELSDPHHEFFVAEQDPPVVMPQEKKSRDATTTEWDGKYILNHDMLPTVMTEDLGRKAFLIGKSLNFLRHSCGDSIWVEAYCKDATRELHYGNTATLETSIDKAYKVTMARLTHLMISKFRVFEHLQALKKYILLGQGDFIAMLLECVASDLDQPAGTQYRHVLTAHLENAIRGSNAQYDQEEILQGLDVKILDLSHGDLGWDVFSLEYKAGVPVNVILTPTESQKYLKMFNLLWRVKRVEFSLGSTWRRCMTGARGVLAELDDQMSREWKAARCCMAEMIHFTNHLQYYVLFEVIEASWNKLQAAITKPDCTLDDMIKAHSKYLDSITGKGLLGPPRHAITGTREEALSSQLHQMLKIMLAYRDAVDGLYSFSVADFTRRHERSAQVKNSSSRSARLPIKERTDSPFPVNDILAGGSLGESEDQMLSALRIRLAALSDDFRAKIAILLGDLAAQPDVNLRFLAMVMNFNDVYQPRKRKRVAPPPPESVSLPGSSGTSEREDYQEIEKGREMGGEGGKNGEAGGGHSRVSSRTVVTFESRPPQKEKREGRDGDVGGKSEDGENDVAAGNVRAMKSRTTMTSRRNKEERREEGSDESEIKKRDERRRDHHPAAAAAAAHSRTTSRTGNVNVSERQVEKLREREREREAKGTNGNPKTESENATATSVGNPKIPSRTTTTTSDRQRLHRLHQREREREREREQEDRRDDRRDDRRGEENNENVDVDDDNGDDEQAGAGASAGAGANGRDKDRDRDKGRDVEKISGYPRRQHHLQHQQLRQQHDEEREKRKEGGGGGGGGGGVGGVGGGAGGGGGGGGEGDAQAQAQAQAQTQAQATRRKERRREKIES